MERQIRLAGCNNFRDLGGYPTADGGQVRWRVLFRSDGLQHLTARDLEVLRGELAIGDVVDLRSSHEVETDGRGDLARTEVRFHHLPLFDRKRGEAQHRPPPDATLADLYLGMLENARKPIASVLTTLATAPGAAVFHCAAGKDRTGVISALILGLLDVPREIIIADYAATKENLDAIVARLMESRGYERVFEDLPADTLHAEADTMEALIGALERAYGSARDYLREAGMSDDAVARLRERMIE